MFKKFIGIGILSFIFNMLLFFLVGSIIVSTVKKVKDECGETYNIERHTPISGNFFCQSKE